MRHSPPPPSHAPLPAVNHSHHAPRQANGYRYSPPRAYSQQQQQQQQGQQGHSLEEDLRFLQNKLSQLKKDLGEEVRRRLLE